MRALKQYVAEQTEILEFTDNVTEIPLVQAVHVEPNPWRLLAHLYGRSVETSTLPGHPYPDELIAQGGELDTNYWQETPELDLRFADWLRQWSFFDSDSFEPELLVRVHLCEEHRRDYDKEDWSYDDIVPHREELTKIAKDYGKANFAIVFEERERAIAATAPGSGIQSATLRSGPGTVGGYLKDSAGNLAGLTCAHVVSKGQLVEDLSGYQVGKCYNSSKLRSAPPVHLCRIGAKNMNSLDISIFDTKHPAQFPASGMRESTHYGSGQRVCMQGAKSGGPKDYYYGSIGLIQSIAINGQQHCFENLCSIRPYSSLPLVSWAKRMLTHRALRGDSGAWITNPTQTQWFGMLCAVDGTEGFAMDASDCMDWVQLTSKQSFSVH